MKSVVVGLGNDVEENARRTLKSLGLSDEEINKKLYEWHQEKSEDEVLETFRNLFDD